MLKKDNPRTDFFTTEEYQRLLKELKPDLRPLLTVSFYTGARRGELLKLRWADVDLKLGMLKFRDTKNDEDRFVPLTKEAKQALEELRAAHPNSDFVFVRQDGTPVRNFRRAWDGAKERAGLDVKERRFHGLRRGVVTNLAEAGVPEQTAMAYTGHRDTATHRKYRQLMQSNLLQAAQALQAHVKKNGHKLGTAKPAKKTRTRK